MKDYLELSEHWLTLKLKDRWTTTNIEKNIMTIWDNDYKWNNNYKPIRIGMN